MKKAISLFSAIMIVFLLFDSIQSNSFADNLANTLKELPNYNSASSVAPSPNDILAVDSGYEIHFPQSESYFADYTVMYVDVPKKHSAYVYSKPDNSATKLPYAYQGSKVIALAEESGYYCILYTADDHVRNAGWIQKDFVSRVCPGNSYDIGDKSWLADYNCVNYGDACTRWSKDPFVGTKVLYTEIQSLPKNLNECQGITIEYKIIGRGTNDDRNRTVYINCGDGWELRGTFSLDKHLSPVRINLYFEEPIPIKGVAVIPANPNNNDFAFRQSVVDVMYAQESDSLLSDTIIHPTSADITKYGMSSRLTDAGDDKQVMKRAHEIYNKYIDLEDVPSTIKQTLSAERIANVIRVFNGEFPVENGRIDYSPLLTLDEISNTYATYCNATSLVEYGTNLKFKPSCVFFEEDSLAHLSAEKNDELLSAIYSDIFARDVQKFVDDSVKWGEFVRDTFFYNDFTGETISIYRFDSEQKFPVAVSIISPYMPSIYEFALNSDLATKTGAMGNTFGITVPYGYKKGELTRVPLSKLIYDINYTPIYDLDIHVGTSQEQKSKEKNPLIVRAYNITLDWFDEKYNLEKEFLERLEK